MRAMKIDHIGIWAHDIELLRDFYTKYLNMECGHKYTNPAKNFSSYFLSFGQGDTRIELMHISGPESISDTAQLKGLAHIAVAVGSREKVNALTEQLRNDGYAILGEPRVTGDGYYESVVADPEGNRIEITV